MNQTDTKDTEEKFIPPGLQPGGSWLPAIQREVRAVLATEAFAQVRRPPPRFLALLLRPWLRFQSRSQAE